MDERKFKKKSSYRMKEVFYILRDELGEMSFNTFQKYHRHDPRLNVRKSSIKNPRVGYKDLCAYIDYYCAHPDEIKAHYKEED